MKKLLFLTAFVFVSGCHRDHDEPTPAPTGAGAIQPPTAPVCGTHLFSDNGGIGGPPPSVLKITIPHFDASKEDTADFSYKRFDATTWSAFKPGFFSDVTFAVSGTTVTITNTTAIQYDWAIAATVGDCH